MVVLHQLSAGGVELLQVHTAAQDLLELSQGVSIRAVGGHGQGQGYRQGRDQGGFFILFPGLLQQLQAEGSQNLVDRFAAGRIDGQLVRMEPGL